MYQLLNTYYFYIYCYTFYILVIISIHYYLKIWTINELKISSTIIYNISSVKFFYMVYQ